MRSIRKFIGASLVALVPSGIIICIVELAGWRPLVIAVGVSLLVIGVLAVGFWLLDDGGR